MLAYFIGNSWFPDRIVAVIKVRWCLLTHATFFCLGSNSPDWVCDSHQIHGYLFLVLFFFLLYVWNTFSRLWCFWRSVNKLNKSHTNLALCRFGNLRHSHCCPACQKVGLIWKVQCVILRCDMRLIYLVLYACRNCNILSFSLSVIWQYILLLGQYGK